MWDDQRRVILVGGAPGVGKSTVARAIAARWGAASLTVDDVMVAARYLTTEESHPALHPMRVVGGHVNYFSNAPLEQLVEDALAQEAAVWPIVERLVASHIANESPVVIDWWLLRPRDVALLNNSGVASVWLYLEPAVLWERERRNTSFTAGSADPQQMLANFMHRSLWRNDLIATEAERAGLSLMRLNGTESVDALVDRVFEMDGGPEGASHAASN